MILDCQLTPNEVTGDLLRWSRWGGPTHTHTEEQATQRAGQMLALEAGVTRLYAKDVGSHPELEPSSLSVPKGGRPPDTRLQPSDADSWFSGLQHYKGINIRCFKSPSSRSLVTAAIGNQRTGVGRSEFALCHAAGEEPR